MPQPPDDDRVGILFVHGMGNHQRGDILRQLGEPLYHWVTGWLKGGDPDLYHPLRARETSFRIPHRGERDAPAHTTVETIVTGEDGTRRPVTWVVAEGWWADEIVPPSFSQVASWGLGLAPWMIVRHFRSRWGGVLLLPSLLIVVLFQIVILALTLLGAIPRLRGYIVGVQLAITGSLGDVMVMASSPLQFSAMTTRLTGDLRWLRTQVPRGRIAVIAHSQGTGVAHATLRESRVPVDLFVTFGAALEKLHIAREVQQNRRRLALGSTLTTVGVVFLGLAAGTWIKADPFSGDPGSTYLVSRGLLAAGAVLILARMALWFNLTRIPGALLSLAGVAAFLTGIALANSPKPLTDRSLDEAITHIHRTAWSDLTSDGWTSASLAAFTAGLLLVVAREIAVLFMRERIKDGTPDPHASSPPLQGVPVLGALLNPVSAFGNFITVGALIFGIFCLAMAPGGGRPAQDDAILLLVTAGLAFCFAAVPIPVPGVTEPTAEDFRIRRREPRLSWHNYWASADLVPDGDLPVETLPPYVHNHAIINQRSILADHTTYHENTEEFLSDVADRLARLARWPLICEDETEIVTCASLRRRARVAFLTMAGMISILGMGATWWILGRAGLTPLGRPLESLLGNVISVIPGISAETARKWLPAWLLGALVVAAITFFWYRILLFQAWRYWDQVEAAFLFHREPSTRGVGSIRFERGFTTLLFALSSGIGLTAGIWSPNLLRLTAERLKLFDVPAICTGCGFGWILDWPGNRDTVPAAGIWGWPWWAIITSAAIITLVYWSIILRSLGRGGRN